MFDLLKIINISGLDTILIGTQEFGTSLAKGTDAIDTDGSIKTNHSEEWDPKPSDYLIFSFFGTEGGATEGKRLSPPLVHSLSKMNLGG